MSTIDTATLTEIKKIALRRGVRDYSYTVWSGERYASFDGCAMIIEHGRYYLCLGHQSEGDGYHVTREDRITVEEIDPETFLRKPKSAYAPGYVDDPMISARIRAGTMEVGTNVYETYEEFMNRSDKSLNGVSRDFARVFPFYYRENLQNIGCWNTLFVRNRHEDRHRVSNIWGPIGLENQPSVVVSNLHKKVLRILEKDPGMKTTDFRGNQRCRAVVSAGGPNARLLFKTFASTGMVRPERMVSDIIYLANGHDEGTSTGYGILKHAGNSPAINTTFKFGA